MVVGRFKYVHYYLFPPEIYPFSLCRLAEAALYVYIFMPGLVYSLRFSIRHGVEALRIQGL